MYTALLLYDEINKNKIDIDGDNVIHLLALKACGNLRDFKRGQNIFYYLLKHSGNKLKAAYIVFCKKCKQKIDINDVINIESYKDAINLVNKNEDSMDIDIIDNMLQEFKLLFVHKFTKSESFHCLINKYDPTRHHHIYRMPSCA